MKIEKAEELNQLAISGQNQADNVNCDRYISADDYDQDYKKYLEKRNMEIKSTVAILIAITVCVATYIWQENFLLCYLTISLSYVTSCGILGVDILGLDDACGCNSVDASGSDSVDASGSGGTGFLPDSSDGDSGSDWGGADFGDFF